jgi:hypothetical protein
MKSPITGKQMLLKQTLAVYQFRNEQFEIRYHYYQCKDTFRIFEDQTQAQLNLTQAYRQYCLKHSLSLLEFFG